MRFIRRPSARQVRAALELWRALGLRGDEDRLRDPLLDSDNTTKAERPQGAKDAGCVVGG